MVYVKVDSMFQNFLQVPRFILNLDCLSSTEKLIYMQLIDRSRLSQHNNWVDAQGNVFIVYTIDSLATDMHVKQSTVKNALKNLEENKLIVRQHQGLGRPNRIYVKVPHDALQGESKTSARQPENYLLQDSQKTTCMVDKKVATNNNNNNKTNYIKNEQNKGRTPYGTYNNVMLSEDEYQALKQVIPDVDGYIEKISCYMESVGTTYKNYAATVRLWYLNDKDKQSAHRTKKSNGNKFTDFPQRTYDTQQLEKELLKYGTK